MGVGRGVGDGVGGGNVGAGVALGDGLGLGGSVVGGGVLTCGVELRGDGIDEADAVGDAVGDCDAPPTRAGTFRNTAAAITIVARLPAIAARPRSM